MVAVRVMDCTGEGAMSTIISGLEWVLDNLQLPAVVLMSIGGDATLLLDQACEALVNAGATVVVAAGNDNEGMAACCKPCTVRQSCSWANSTILKSNQSKQCPAGRAYCVGQGRARHTLLSRQCTGM